MCTAYFSLYPRVPPVYASKDDAWENLILTVDNVLCHCPRHWTDLDVWSALRLCEDLSIK